MTALTLMLAACLAVCVYLLRKRMNGGGENARQAAQLRQFEQRLTQVAQQSTEQVTMAVLQLEERLEQANATIEELRYRTQLAEGLLWQNRQPEQGREGETAAAPLAAKPPEAIAFSRQLAVAAYQLSQTHVEQDQAPEAGGEAGTSAAIFKAAGSLSDDKADRYERVIALAANGLDDVAIARQLNLGIGEVRLAKQLLHGQARRHE